ncbi:MAG: efflux RND transporter permease subunit, partial [Phycisphaerae bacterium]|nr:efflux RND transporter permease subunit [Phycisphaerae bacterium]
MTLTGLRRLIAAGVHNPVYSNVLMICILVGGYLSARTLVTETYPEFSLDRISIEVVYPGASPEEVEQGVCTKIEEVLEGLPGVKQIWSAISESKALIIVRLLENVRDPSLMMLDIKDRVEQIDTFPPEVEKPVIAEMMVREQVINVAIYGDAPERAIKELAVEIKDELLSDEAISQVVLTGVRDYEISIEVSQEALLQYGLTLEDVRAVVARNCLDVPAGTLRTSHEELTLRTVGQRYTAREFEDLAAIARPDGTLIKLNQLAKITDGFEEGYKSGRFQGQPAAVLQVFKTTAEDTATIASAVHAYVTHKQAELPARMHIEVWGDTSREVQARIDMLLENAVLGMGLVVLVLALFLDFRISLYVALGIPVSFAGALIVMHFTGQTLNMLTLFSLIMVSGIIVDDAVVIADSFRGSVSQGDTPGLAAINGAGAVALPVLGSSATTIVAFAPLLFVAGIMGKFIAVMPVVVISAVVFSAVEAFCILPSHLRHCLHHPKPSGSAGATLRRRRAAARERIERGIDRVIMHVYRPFCRRALHARGVTLCVAVACAVLVGGLVAGGRIPFTLLPEID